MNWIKKARDRFYANRKKEGTDQAKIVEWLLDNPGVEFTTKSLSGILSVPTASVSYTIRNTKTFMGFKYESKPLTSNVRSCLKSYKLVGCEFKTNDLHKASKNEISLNSVFN